jgi:hypothetical protein
MDLGHAKLRLKVRITTDDGSSLDLEKHDVGPVNNFIHSLFSACHVELNQKVVSQSNLYGYRAIIENLLNYGHDAYESHLQSSLFIKDTSGHMDFSNSNAGFLSRRALSQTEFDMESHIHSDLFCQNKYLLNGVQMVVKFYRAPNKFALMTSTTDTTIYKIKITEATLLVRKVKVNPAVVLAHNIALAKFTAKYPIKRVDVKNITLTKGIQDVFLENVCLGILPSRLVIGFVKSSAFNGSITSNPFNFEHFNNTYINVITDAEHQVTPLEPNYGKNQYMPSYNSLFAATGINFNDSGVMISRNEYPKGYNLSVFDLSPDISSHEPHLNTAKSGALRISLKFSKVLAEAVTAIVYLEFDNLIEIDRYRQINLDYST